MSPNWLRGLFARCSGPRRRGPQRKRLAFEPLESRDLLATFAVDIADPGCGDPGDKLFCEIQEAVDVASEGDKIKVHAGTFQPFVVNKDNLTIREAKGKSDPMIDATGARNGIEVNANGVTLKGLEVQNAISNGFFVNGDDNTLRNNATRDNGRNGFRLFTSGGNSLHGNTATDNGANGFDLDRSSDNTLRGNMAGGNGRRGFYLSTLSNNNTRQGNTASDNDFDGFFLWESSNNTLARNTASGSGLDGFLLADSSDNALIKYKAINNAGWGFWIEELLANMFEDNKCKGNVLGGSNLPDVC